MASPSLDDYLAGVVTSDTKKRVETGEALIVYLQDADCSLYCEETDKFMEGLAGWVSSSNFKVSLLGIQVITLLVDRMESHFKPHVTTVLPNTVDRLGDGKDQVREGARELIIKMMGRAATPQYVLERLNSAFSHKLWKVKEELLICIQNCLIEFGAKNVGVSKIVPQVVKLLDDQSIPVRDQAVTTLVEMYRHVGEKLRNDLSKREINPTRLNQIYYKMDELQAAGLVLANEDDDTDSVQSTQSSKPIAKRSTSSNRTSSASSSILSKTSAKSSAASAGAMDEESFTRSFDDVPKLRIFSVKDMTDNITKIRETLSDNNVDWEKRVDALKLIRALVLQESTQFSEFNQQLRTLENCVRSSVADLRSQVVREACVTISFLSERLGKEFDHFAEVVVPTLIQLVPNSAKVMATSGVVALKFIVQYTHAPRIIPLITCNLTTKSAVIRKQCCELIDLILRTWSTSTLERQVAPLQDFIKRGLTDADADARVFARKAYWGFEDHFKDQAAVLFNALDPTQQKLLQGACSSSSSSSSLNTAGRQQRAPSKTRARSISQDRTGSSGYGRSVGQASRGQPVVSKPARIPRSLPSEDGSTYGMDDGDGRTTPGLPRYVQGSGKASRVSGVGAGAGNYASLPRQRKASGGGMTTYSGAGPSGVLSPEKQHRARAKMSQSQPGSRSNSPNSRLSYLSHHQNDGTSYGKASRVRSTASSRDTSPTHGDKDRRTSRAGRVSVGPGVGRSQAGGRLSAVNHGEDIEAVADALMKTRRGDGEGMTEDGLSETSSVCSEGSYRSFGTVGSEDMNEILTFMLSGSWSERRDGLIALQTYLHNKALTRAELKKATEIFTRMFHDPHPKVFSGFLDALVDLLSVHSSDLHEWLPTCLNRIINKLGSDQLSSVQSKMIFALETIRDLFPYSTQFGIAAKYIVEQTPAPNLKVKMGLLNYLHGLILAMSPSDIGNNADTRLAISRFITWTTEPKSVDIRKAAQAVLLAMNALNPTEFSAMCAGLPKTFKDSVMKIIETHARDGSEPLSPHNMAAGSTRFGAARGSSVPRTTVIGQRLNTSGPAAIGSEDSENMNPEDIYQSIKQATADLQSLSCYDDPSAPMGGQRRGLNPHKSPVSLLPRPNSRTSPRGPNDQTKYNPNHYQDNNLRMKSNGTALQHGGQTLSGLDTGIHDNIFDEKFPDNADAAEFMIEDLVADLSKINENDAERMEALRLIIQLAKEDDKEFWNDNFKRILGLLLENLNDNNENIRKQALRVLREMARCVPQMFREYAELTIVKILDALKDPAREVVIAAEQCSSMIALAIPPEQCLPILSQFAQTSEYPINLGAIKMQIKVIESINSIETMRQLLPVVIPGLLRGYDHNESPVRKASVFCLVAIYLIIGEELRTALSDLSSHKVKLLNLYIKRALAHRNDGSSTTSPSSASPASVIDLV